MNGTCAHTAPHAAAGGAAPLVLEVQHVTQYRYSAPVSLAHHLAHLQPLQDDYQQLLAYELDIDPSPDAAPQAPAGAALRAPEQMQMQMQLLGQSQGPFGMQMQAQVFAADLSARAHEGAAQRFFSLTQPHRHLRVRASSRVRVAPRFLGLQPALSQPWDAQAQGLRFSAQLPYQAAAQFAYPSPYVPRMPELLAYAEASFPAGRPVVQGALDLMQRLHRDFRYEADSTRIDTPLAQVLRQRRGVCQDFAHLMIGALRMLGLPARYVSGYLLTQPSDGGPALVGADATHAWVQLWCPGTPGVPATGDAAAWLDMDPTNNRVPGTGHVRLAVGRDFGDVTPLRGVIRGGGRHNLTVGVSTRVLSVP